jgi:murein DD-endopeptidase MepM/ murein hydrolase activator NlpD
MALDSFAENAPGEARAGYRGPGNFVAIDHGGGELSVLVHLRRGSVRVATGQKIEAGDTVGECGNNGESVFPHLHYQLQLDPRPGQKPVPAPFNDFMAEGVRVARGQPTRGQRVIHAARP